MDTNEKYRSTWIVDNPAMNRYLTMHGQGWRWPLLSEVDIDAELEAHPLDKEDRQYLELRERFRSRIVQDLRFTRFVAVAYFSAVRETLPFEVQRRLIVVQSCLHPVENEHVGPYRYRHLIVPTGTRSFERRDEGPDDQDRARLNTFITAANEGISNLEGHEGAKFSHEHFKFHVVPESQLEEPRFDLCEVMEFFLDPSWGNLYGTYVPDFLASNDHVTKSGREELLRLYPKE